MKGNGMAGGVGSGLALRRSVAAGGGGGTALRRTFAVGRVNGRSAVIQLACAARARPGAGALAVARAAAPTIH